jgi:hypothetical protein
MLTSRHLTVDFQARYSKLLGTLDLTSGYLTLDFQAP